MKATNFSPTRKTTPPKSGANNHLHTSDTAPTAAAPPTAGRAAAPFLYRYIRDYARAHEPHLPLLLPLRGASDVTARNPGCRFATLACPGLGAFAPPGRALNAWKNPGCPPGRALNVGCLCGGRGQVAVVARWCSLPTSTYVKIQTGFLSQQTQALKKQIQAPENQSQRLKIRSLDLSVRPAGLAVRGLPAERGADAVLEVSAR